MPSFVLLKPRVLPPRTSKVLVLNPDDPYAWVVRERRSKSEPMALDFETRGLPLDQFSGKPSYPVGVALADSRGSVYVPFYHDPADVGSDTRAYPQLMALLRDEQVPLLAHNVPFDGLWPMRDFEPGLKGPGLNWLACTLAAYKLCATEGEFDQRWGLKAAMTDLLGWTETNEAGIDTWLVSNGYTKQLFKEPGAGRLPAPASAEGPRWGTADKAEMWRVPHTILGHYAALDADACWQLWTSILEPCLRSYPVLREYCLEWYPPYMRGLMEQTLRGIQLHVPMAKVLKARTEGQVIKLTDDVLTSPSVAPHQEAWAHKAAMEVHKTQPKRLTKAGDVSKNWLKWQARVEAAGQTKLNLGSGDQMRWLLYTQLGNPILSRTDSGLPATDEGALKSMGQLGKDLLAVQDQRKLVQFYNQALALADPQGVIRPAFSIPGTVTGRLSGKEPNVQQMPGDAAFLSTWGARPGYKIVCCDVTALENYVLTELSRDPALMKLYGPGAREGQDAYLFNAANLPGIGPRIRQAGYNPDTATAEETAAAKKACKRERAIGKVFTLSANYGAGPKKIQETLRLQAGITLDLEEVEEMHRGFWTLYTGIQDYERELGRQWRRNRGWVLNGIGRPLAVCADKRKDLVNSVCQSTGHDLLIRLIHYTVKRLNASGISWFPWILDLHDATYLEVEESRAEEALDIMQRLAYDDLNEWGGQLIPLRGVGKVMQHWGEAISE